MRCARSHVLPAVVASRYLSQCRDDLVEAANARALERAAFASGGTEALGGRDRARG